MRAALDPPCTKCPIRPGSARPVLIEAEGGRERDEEDGGGAAGSHHLRPGFEVGEGLCKRIRRGGGGIGGKGRGGRGGAVGFCEEGKGRGWSCFAKRGREGRRASGREESPSAAEEE